MNYDDLVNSSMMWIYGYSNLGRNAYNKFKSLWPEKTKGIIVSKHNEKSKNSEKNVLEVHEAEIENSVIVIATNPLFHGKITDTLKEKRVSPKKIYI